MTKPVHVAVALIRQQDKVLIALRPDHLHQGGLWEFPGGKVEPRELPEDALAREIKEELAISIVKAAPALKLAYDYPDKSVLLDIWEVSEFAGRAIGNEGQQIAWVSLMDLNDYEFPAANKPILEYLFKDVRR